MACMASSILSLQDDHQYNHAFRLVATRAPAGVHVGVRSPSVHRVVTSARWCCITCTHARRHWEKHSVPTAQLVRDREPEILPGFTNSPRRLRIYAQDATSSRNTAKIARNPRKSTCASGWNCPMCMHIACGPGSLQRFDRCCGILL